MLTRLVVVALILRRLLTPKSGQGASATTRHVDNPIGLLIDDEVRRAESDLAAIRTRAQGVLAVSGALVTVLAGVLALAVGESAQLDLRDVTVVAAAVTLLAFVLATGLVLIIFRPVNASAPNAKNLLDIAKNKWGQTGWDQDVAENLAAYLVSLRKVNRAQAKRLSLAITLQAIGILGAALMALSLLSQAVER